MSLEVIKGRIYFNSKKMAHIIWNEYNPNNMIKKGYVIHHIDRNPMNDDINNLQMLNKADHLSLHHKGKIVSKESRKKMSASKTGEKHSLYGKHHSEETKIKISLSKSGERNHFFGKKFSEEHKKKISEKLSGRKLSSEHKLNLSKSKIGKAGNPMSEDNKIKLRNARLGIKRDKYIGMKISKTKIRKKFLKVLYIIQQRKAAWLCK